MTTVAGFTLVYGKWWAWHGDHAWGPRLLVPFVPLLLIGLLGAPRSTATRVLAGVTACCAVFVNLSAVILSPETYFRYAEATVARVLPHLAAAPALTVADPSVLQHFVPAFSPVLFQSCAVHRWLELGAGTSLPAGCHRRVPWSSISPGFAMALEDGDLVSHPLLLSGRPGERVALVIVVGIMLAAGLVLWRSRVPPDDSTAVVHIK
jgi:hypothetical protein